MRKLCSCGSGGRTVPNGTHSQNFRTIHHTPQMRQGLFVRESHHALNEVAFKHRELAGWGMQLGQPLLTGHQQATYKAQYQASAIRFCRPSTPTEMAFGRFLGVKWNLDHFAQQIWDLSPKGGFVYWTGLSLDLNMDVCILGGMGIKIRSVIKK